MPIVCPRHTGESSRSSRFSHPNNIGLCGLRAWHDSSCLKHVVRITDAMHGAPSVLSHRSWCDSSDGQLHSAVCRGLEKHAARHMPVRSISWPAVSGTRSATAEAARSLAAVKDESDQAFDNVVACVHLGTRVSKTPVPTPERLCGSRSATDVGRCRRLMWCEHCACDASLHQSPTYPLRD